MSSVLFSHQSLQKHNKHFDVDTDADLDPEPSSEHDGHSPYRKRQASSRVKTVLVSTKQSDALQSDSLASQPLPSTKNGHYELVDSSRTRSLKRSTAKSKSGSASSSSGEYWSSKSVQHPLRFGGKQLQQPQQNNAAPHEHSVVKQNTRTHHKSLSNRILSLKRENKTTRTLSIVVGGFIVCWLPFFIFYLITPFLPNKPPALATLNTYLTWLGWLNSAMNPFIYAFYSVDFRAAFWRLTLRRFFKNANKAPYSSNVMSIKR